MQFLLRNIDSTNHRVEFRSRGEFLNFQFTDEPLNVGDVQMLNDGEVLQACLTAHKGPQIVCANAKNYVEFMSEADLRVSAIYINGNEYSFDNEYIDVAFANTPEAENITVGIHQETSTWYILNHSPAIYSIAIDFVNNPTMNIPESDVSNISYENNQLVFCLNPRREADIYGYPGVNAYIGTEYLVTAGYYSEEAGGSSYDDDEFTLTITGVDGVNYINNDYSREARFTPSAVGEITITVNQKHYGEIFRHTVQALEYPTLPLNLPEMFDWNIVNTATRVDTFEQKFTDGLTPTYGTLTYHADTVTLVQYDPVLFYRGEAQFVAVGSADVYVKGRHPELWVDITSNKRRINVFDYPRDINVGDIPINTKKETIVELVGAPTLPEGWTVSLELSSPTTLDGVEFSTDPENPLNVIVDVGQTDYRGYVNLWLVYINPLGVRTQLTTLNCRITD